MSVQQQQNESGVDPQVLLEVAKWLVENSGAIGNLWSVMTGGVTNIKQWVNESSQQLEVWKVDGGRRENAYSIAPGRTLRAEMWISWCNNTDEYPRKHVTLMLGGRLLAVLWQRERVVYFNAVDAFAVERSMPRVSPVQAANAGLSSARTPPAGPDS